MTNFATHALLGSPAASLVGKDKGDVSNRAKCAGAQFVNNAKTLAADTVVIGGAAATLKAMKKGKLQRAQKFFEKLVDKVANKLPKKLKTSISNSKVDKEISKNLGKKTIGKINLKFVDSKLATKLKGLPGFAKAAVAITAIAAPLVAYINHKNIFKSGQIDQKYTDKAKIEKQTKEMV